MTKSEITMEEKIADALIKTDLTAVELRDARIAGIEGLDSSAMSAANLIGSGIEGKNQSERDAALHITLAGLGHIKAVSKAKKARITAETKYSAAKRSLRIMELIYKVQNDEI